MTQDNNQKLVINTSCHLQHSKIIFFTVFVVDVVSKVNSLFLLEDDVDDVPRDDEEEDGGADVLRVSFQKGRIVGPKSGGWWTLAVFSWKPLLHPQAHRLRVHSIQSACPDPCTPLPSLWTRPPGNSSLSPPLPTSCTVYLNLS